MNGKPFNKLTNAEAERLALLSEELGEAQQVIGKILRHGYESKNPVIPGSGTNRRLLEKELGDVSVAVQLLLQHDDIDEETIQVEATEKGRNVNKYLHHNKLDTD